MGLSLPPTITSIPTPTAQAPIIDEIGAELVDRFRIESVWTCGGSMSRCLHAESDPLILTRVAMGEAPHSLSDRVFIMWSIRLRAALGFKEALPGYLAVPDRWGPETSIAVEALCNGGCQYAPVRTVDGIYFPCEELDEHHALRPMLCPTDEQLEDFYWTWTFAEAIAFANMDHFPVELRGYESFRSPTITGPGQFNRVGGLRSIQFFRGANIWRDEFPQDNAFWDQFPIPTQTATPFPTATPVPTGTAAVLSTATVSATLDVVPTVSIKKEDPIELIYCFPLGASVLAGAILTLRDLRRKHEIET